MKEGGKEERRKRGEVKGIRNRWGRESGRRKQQQRKRRGGGEGNESEWGEGVRGREREREGGWKREIKRQVVFFRGATVDNSNR